MKLYTEDILIRFSYDSILNPYEGIRLISRLIKIPTSIEIL